MNRRLGPIVTAVDFQVRLTSQWLLELDFEKGCSEYLGKIVPYNMEYNEKEKEDGRQMWKRQEERERGKRVWGVEKNIKGRNKKDHTIGQIF